GMAQAGAAARPVRARLARLRAVRGPLGLELGRFQPAARELPGGRSRGAGRALGRAQARAPAVDRTGVATEARAVVSGRATAGDAIAIRSTRDRIGQCVRSAAEAVAAKPFNAPR